ncbi:N(G),N(G)-dimethylarginine dimethylaminohydrolase [Actinomadura sp. ATCC 31491]|uniref:N(G),N(G)-dimethylarginine dimethylaminohydrolase n=1 Tax=Actinomadura luzonensis TaxID=2805427 RepID=A0ABT0G5R5_9ACTN|nr:dimethylargininase [Actinomadura luzonensis]MCK2219956.1 N(G),N(G)-dimethylarginine dimethylaminohydrolase [Actinomadura luzonensis]
MSGIALVRKPGPRIAEGIVTHLQREPVDPVKALDQHDAYVAALEAAGRRVVYADPADDLPDAPFVEDTVVVSGRVAVLTRPGAAERRPEVESVARAVRDLGLKTVMIARPGTLDGGDVLQSGPVVYAGRSARTNDEGIGQLTALLPERRVVPVNVRGVLHLKSAVTALPDGTLIGDPRHVDLPGLLVPPEEPGAHVVPLDGSRVLLAASAPRTAALLESRGLDVTTVDISEFEKLEGCVTCLSVLVDD